MSLHPVAGVALERGIQLNRAWPVLERALKTNGPTGNKNHEAQRSADFKESIMVQILTGFFSRVAKNESFRKGVAAAGAGALMAVISTLIWEDR
jgi:hypothetical protein